MTRTIDIDALKLGRLIKGVDQCDITPGDIDISDYVTIVWELK